LTAEGAGDQHPVSEGALRYSRKVRRTSRMSSHSSGLEALKTAAAFRHSWGLVELADACGDQMLRAHEA
jgi:hypothetical protein